MEYYSAIQRNEIELFVMRWMDLESVIQSEVSQKEKNKYRTEGWDREGDREGDARAKRYGDICIYIADSLCYKAETNTPLYSNYTPLKMLKKKAII